MLINEELRDALGLQPPAVDRAIAETRENVSERVAGFTGNRTFPALAGKTVILTDDGLASGFTMLAAIQSIRQKKPSRVIVAVPTASLAAAKLVAAHADLVACPNIRSSRMFAVADAYAEWYDLDDQEVQKELEDAP